MEGIALRTQKPTGVNGDEVRKVLSSALRNEAELADARRAYFERACRAFEQQYQMSSDEFMQQFESGALGDDVEYFDWYAAKRGLDLWERRFRILSGVQV
jgi:Fe-S cluster assembly ATPase SufC